MSAFGSGPSNGQFWYGSQTNFPGFLYKKNVGVGGRRSTKMAPGGNITCNSATDLYNKYKPGTGGVGASSTANRRAKNRLATICGSSNKCFPCYNTLGQYSNYTHNPNGFVPCPGTINIISSSGSVTPSPSPSVTYIVTYLGNGNTGGTSPTDSNSPYNSGTSVTILGNSNSLIKSGAVFAGWNTLPNGTGTNYAGGDTFIMPASNTILYANWVAGGSRLRYFAGTGGSGTAPSSSGTYYTPFSTANIVGNTGSFSNGSLIFAGWNTVANGSGTSYPVGSNITMPSSGNVDLYAQWIPAGGPFTLTYDPGTGGTGSAPVGPTPYPAGSPANIDGNTGSPPFSNGTQVFNGWNTVANGSGTSYPVGSKITMTANTTLYAQWGSPPSLTLTYNANGGTGTIPSQSYPTGAQATILGQSSLTRPGYSFLGWNSDSNGTGSIYQPTNSIVMNTNTTLYAQWVGGTLFRQCVTGGSGTTTASAPFTYIWGGQSSGNVYRDNTNSTITGIIQILYNKSNTGPYGTGNGPSDTPPTPNPLNLPTHSGNIKSSLANVVLSQAGPTTYEINITYIAIYTGTGTDIPYTVTANLPLTTAYWPTGETFNTITTSISPITYTFGTGDVQGSPTASITNGCQGGGSSTLGSPNISVNQIITTFYINFSNGTSTRIALSSTLKWTSNGATNPYTYVYNYTRVELASGLTSSIPNLTTNTTAINTPNV